MGDETSQAALAIYPNHKTLSLATTGPAGLWLGSHYFAEAGEGRHDFFMTITCGTHTHTNLSANPTAAYTIDGGNPFVAFLQGQAKLVPLTGQAKEDAKGILSSKCPEVFGFWNALPPDGYTIFHLVPQRIFVTDIPNGWLPAREQALES